MHPTIVPPPISGISNGDWGVKLITIIDFQIAVTELVITLVNGGTVAALAPLITLWWLKGSSTKSIKMQSVTREK